MLANNRFGAGLGVFGSCSDRYCRSGYGLGGTTIAEKLDLATKVEGLDGVELVGNWDVNNKTIGDIPQLLSDHGLELCMMVPDVWTQSKWRRGSLAAPDQSRRWMEVCIPLSSVWGWMHSKRSSRPPMPAKCLN